MLYFHFTDGTLMVKKCDIVTKGQKLAQICTSSSSTGVHLSVALIDNDGRGTDFEKNCQPDAWKLCYVKHKERRSARFD